MTVRNVLHPHPLFPLVRNKYPSLASKEVNKCWSSLKSFSKNSTEIKRITAIETIQAFSNKNNSKGQVSQHKRKHVRNLRNSTACAFQVSLKHWQRQAQDVCLSAESFEHSPAGDLMSLVMGWAGWFFPFKSKPCFHWNQHQRSWLL